MKNSLRLVTGSLVVAAVGAALLLAGASNASADPIPSGSSLDEHHEVTGGLVGSAPVAEAFTVGATGSITAVGLQVYMNPAASTGYLENVDAYGTPDGTRVAQFTIPQVDAVPGSDPLLVLALDTPLLVTVGDRLAIVSETADIAFDDAAATSNGDEGWHLDGDWTPSGGKFGFATYVHPRPVAPDFEVHTTVGTPIDIPMTSTPGQTATLLPYGFGPEIGQATSSGDVATFTPGPGFEGYSPLLYTLADAGGTSEVGTITVWVDPAPTAPPTASPTPTPTDSAAATAVVTPARSALAETGIDTLWLAWPAAALLLLGAVALAVAAVVRRMRRRAG